jgi:branched-chain amino acid aminotransferase
VAQVEVYINGVLLNAAQAGVPVDDRGFLYGDGAFETMRVYDGMPFLIERHLARLRASLAGLRIDPGYQYTDQTFMRAVQGVIEANEVSEGVVRLTVTRGQSTGALLPTPGSRPSVIVTSRPVPPYPSVWRREGLSVAITGTRRVHREALDSSIKSMNFLNSIMARIEAADAGADEAVMLNHPGMLAEGSVSNIFLVRGGVLMTPSLDMDILAGITRGVVIELARDAGLTVEEGSFGPDELRHADEAFLTNSTMEVMPIGKVDGSRLREVPGPLTSRLYQAFQVYVQRYYAAGRKQADSRV